MGSGRGIRQFLCLVVISLCSITLFAAEGPTVTLSVDASEAPRKMIHAQLRIPAKPGSLTLYYPKWIPGEHGPTGPITDLTGLKFTAGGKTLVERRALLARVFFFIGVSPGLQRV